MSKQRDKVLPLSRPKQGPKDSPPGASLDAVATLDINDDAISLAPASVAILDLNVSTLALVGREQTEAPPETSAETISGTITRLAAGTGETTVQNGFMLPLKVEGSFFLEPADLAALQVEVDGVPVAAFVGDKLMPRPDGSLDVVYLDCDVGTMTQWGTKAITLRKGVTSPPRRTERPVSNYVRDLVNGPRTSGFPMAFARPAMSVVRESGIITAHRLASEAQIQAAGAPFTTLLSKYDTYVNQWAGPDYLSLPEPRIALYGMTLANWPDWEGDHQDHLNWRGGSTPSTVGYYNMPASLWQRWAMSDGDSPAAWSWFMSACSLASNWINEFYMASVAWKEAQGGAVAEYRWASSLPGEHNRSYEACFHLYALTGDANAKTMVEQGALAHQSIEAQANSWWPDAPFGTTTPQALESARAIERTARAFRYAYKLKIGGPAWLTKHAALVAKMRETNATSGSDRAYTLTADGGAYRDRDLEPGSANPDQMHINAFQEGMWMQELLESELMLGVSAPEKAARRQQMAEMSLHLVANRLTSDSHPLRIGNSYSNVDEYDISESVFINNFFYGMPFEVLGNTSHPSLGTTADGLANAVATYSSDYYLQSSAKQFNEVFSYAWRWASYKLLGLT